MASGKKNYFRHSMFARNDDFVEGLIDKFGLAGYYYWFALIEICAEQSSDEMKKFCKFHESRLYRELKCNSRRLRPVLDYMQTSSKLEYNHTDKYYEIAIYKLPDFMGKYQTKTDPNSPNKRKEKKRKEKKSKKETDVSKKLTNTGSQLANEIVDLWNSKAPEFGLSKIEILNSTRLKLMAKGMKDYPSIGDWRKIFSVLSGKGFTGRDDVYVKPKFEWAFRNNNWVSYHEEYDDLFTEKPKSAEEMHSEIVEFMLSD